MEAAAQPYLRQVSVQALSLYWEHLGTGMVLVKYYLLIRILVERQEYLLNPDVSDIQTITQLVLLLLSRLLDQVLSQVINRYSWLCKRDRHIPETYCQHRLSNFITWQLSFSFLPE